MLQRHILPRWLPIIKITASFRVLKYLDKFGHIKDLRDMWVWRKYPLSNSLFVGARADTYSRVLLFTRYIAESA